jgi:hypothetical protein
MNLSLGLNLVRRGMLKEETLFNYMNEWGGYFGYWTRNENLSLEEEITIYLAAQEQRHLTAKRNREAAYSKQARESLARSEKWQNKLVNDTANFISIDKNIAHKPSNMLPYNTKVVY